VLEIEAARPTTTVLVARHKGLTDRTAA
jgi:hypothetical protein